jgi:AraC family transcriptional regulator of adaptative response/methylated-DNA-[protein]-cysteine methyltransferase
MASDYERVERAITFLDKHHHEQPSLARVAGAVSLSESRLQRLFRRWAGVSPKRFVQYLTAEHARKVLRETQSVLDAALATGLSGPGRLHDLTVNVHALTPGEIRAAGIGVELLHGVADTPFGPAFLAWTDRGVSALSFDVDHALGHEHARWPEADFRHDPAGAAGLSKRVFEGGRVTLQLRGTNFQIRVWEALLRVPEGSLVTYGKIAEALDSPSASRAVGSAVGANPVAFLIPCHRVIRTTGAFGGYRWGEPRKRAIVAWEAARHAASNRPLDPSRAR